MDLNYHLLLNKAHQHLLYIKLEFNDSNKLGKNFDWNIGFDIYYRVNKYL